MNTELVSVGGEYFVRLKEIPDKGDLIMYINAHSTWCDITPNKLYLVVDKYNDYILTIVDDDGELCSVYGTNEGYDTFDDVVVYKKIKQDELNIYLGEW